MLFKYNMKKSFYVQKNVFMNNEKDLSKQTNIL